MFTGLETTAPLWLFFSVAALCVVLVGIAKAGFAGGVGVIATPLMTFVTSAMNAAALLLPLLLACDLISIWYYRRTRDYHILRLMIPAAWVGIGIAAYFLWRFREHRALAEHFMNLVIGWSSLLFVVFQLVRGWLAHRLETRPAPGWLGHLLGIVAGFTSTLSHSGGPPVTIFMLSQQLDRQLFVGTTVWLFTIINFSKLPVYIGLNLLNISNLRVGLLLLPFVPVGVLLGVWLNRTVSARLFNQVVLILLTLVGLQLVTGFDPVTFFRHLFA